MPRPKRGMQSPRVYEPGKRHFELIASVSRSSGLEKDGDALRDFKTQQEYRRFIQGKVDEYWKQFPYGRPARDTKRRDEIQANILILFRKLREGLMSTKRNDAFALEVYGTSLYLAALFSSPVQATSVVSQLLPHMYLHSSPPPDSVIPVAVITLLHFLVTAYPSQSRFFEQLGALPSRLFPKTSNARQWSWDLARTLRQRNYAALDRLTNRNSFAQYFVTQPLSKVDGDLPSNSTTHGAPDNLALAAACSLVDALRKKARDTAWIVIRSAYRELSYGKVEGGSVSLSAVWLCRSLALRPTVPAADVRNEAAMLDEWLRQRQTAGDVKPKEGFEGSWIICKVKR